MRVIRFLSKFTLICNIAFLLFAFFRWLEKKKAVHGSSGELVPFPILKDLIIILGFSAIFINVIMNLIYLILLMTKRLFVPRWIVLLNFIFLLIQLYYFSYYLN